MPNSSRRPAAAPALVRLLRLIGCAGALVLLAGACAPGGADDDVGATQRLQELGQAEGQETGQRVDQGPAAAVPDPEVERLWDEWFGAALGSSDLEEARRTFFERELAIQACMAEDGQTYLARTLPVNPVAAENDRRRQELAGTRAFAEHYGLGIVPFMAEDLVAEEYEEQFAVPDPNAERFETLSPGERLAFLTALFGPPAGTVEDSALSLDWYETTAPQEGCATRAAGAGHAHQLPTEAGTELGEFDAYVGAEPRVVEATERWAACMRARGYEFRTRQDAPDHVVEQTGGGIEFSDRFEEVLVDVQGHEPVRLLVQQYDPAALQRAVEVEIAVALADYDCAEETGVDEVEQAVRREVELAWIGRWLDRLTAAQDG